MITYARKYFWEFTLIATVLAGIFTFLTYLLGNYSISSGVGLGLAGAGIYQFFKRRFPFTTRGHQIATLLFFIFVGLYGIYDPFLKTGFDFSPFGKYQDLVLTMFGGVLFYYLMLSDPNTTLRFKLFLIVLAVISLVLSLFIISVHFLR